MEPVTITIIYDNNPFLKGLQTDWGFACLVEVGKTKLLFDTGELIASDCSGIASPNSPSKKMFACNSWNEETGTDLAPDLFISSCSEMFLMLIILNLELVRLLKLNNNIIKNSFSNESIIKINHLIKAF
jgi:hypothetical protein